MTPTAMTTSDDGDDDEADDDDDDDGQGQKTDPEAAGLGEINDLSAVLD